MTTATKGRPTPPAPQNQFRRFQFFTGPNGKGQTREKIQYEMQRYAFTREGGNMFRKIQKQQREQMELHKTTGLVDAPKSEMKILPPKKPLFSGLKTIFSGMKSQRGS